MTDPWIIQLRKGLIEISVMASLRDEETYGYALLGRLRSGSGLAIGESTLYPLLARLAADGSVAVRVVESANGPPRRYYRLTSRGRERLMDMIGQWRLIRDAVDELVRSPASQEPP